MCSQAMDMKKAHCTGASPSWLLCVMLLLACYTAWRPASPRYNNNNHNKFAVQLMMIGKNVQDRSLLNQIYIH